MADVKTKPTDQKVEEFLNSIADEKKREDSFALLDIFKQVTKLEPKMWGSSIVGFGDYHYKGASGREGDWFFTGFSPRKQNLTLYFMSGFERYNELLKKLGKYSTGKSCLYIKRMDDVHVPTLKKLVRESVKHMRKTNK